jgi:hypothetical protein
MIALISSLILLSQLQVPPVHYSLRVFLFYLWSWIYTNKLTVLSLQLYPPSSLSDGHPALLVTGRFEHKTYSDIL